MDAPPILTRATCWFRLTFRVCLGGGWTRQTATCPCPFRRARSGCAILLSLHKGADELLCRIVRDTRPTGTWSNTRSAPNAIDDTQSVLRVKQVQPYLKQLLGMWASVQYQPDRKKVTWTAKRCPSMMPTMCRLRAPQPIFGRWWRSQLIVMSWSSSLVRTCQSHETDSLSSGRNGVSGSACVKWKCLCSVLH